LIATASLSLAGCAGLVSPNNAGTTQPGAPGITTQPTNQTVTAGQTATFTVVASGTAPLAYQWQKNLVNIAGATAASYTTPATTTADSGSTFVVVVSNTAGTVTSAAATLTANAASDTTPPAVSVTAPANAATVSGTVTVSANATDNVAVASVQFQLDGANLGSLDTATPYTFSWNTTTASNGSHTLRAIAKDTSNNSATSANVTVTVNNATADTTPPTVPTGLTATAASSSQINLSWTASTDNVGVTGYNVNRGGTKIGTSTTASYSDLGLTASTSYTYTVAAFDAAGNTSAPSAGASATTLAGSSGGGLPSTLGWYQIPNTTYAPLCPSGQSGSCQYVVDAWNSGVADTKRNRLVFLGGGHGNYSGNEVYALDLNSLQMLRLTNADPPNEACTDVDPSGNPNSRHTYGGLSYIPSTDQVYMHGGAPYPCGSAGIVSTWLLSLAGPTWARKDPLSGAQVTANCCNYISFSDYDPVTDSVWYTDDYDLWTYKVQTNTQTHLSTVANLGYHQNCAVDYDARLFTCFGDGTVEQASMTAATPTLNDITSQTSGCATLAGTDYSGLTYDPVQKKVIAWIGGGSVIVFDSNAKTCTTQSFSGGPGSQSPTGTFNRWRYFPALGVFALVNNWQQNAWVLRMTASSGGGSGPVISGTSVNSITTTAAVVSWTTDVASTTQVEYGTTTAYGSLTTLNSSLVTSHSQALSGLTAGTVYHYRVHSKNSSGVESLSGDAVFSTNSTTDSTPPTVSLTAPAANVTVSGTATVAANASDNVGVTSLQFTLDGTNLGSAVTASPFQISWDSTTTANGAHILGASARDAAGNVGNAVGVPVVVSNSTSTPSALLDFQTRCAQAGVLICQGFDSPTAFTMATWPNSGLYGDDNNVLQGTMDTTVTASGGGSLRFTVPSNAGSNGSGYWRQLIGQTFGQNSTFYVQFRQRFSPEFLTNKWVSTGGGPTWWKQEIFSSDQSTCGNIELTTVNGDNNGFPQMYSQCGADSLIQDLGNGDFLLEQGDTSTSGYNCHYQNPTPSGCFMYPSNTWVTFCYKVHIGSWGQPNSSIQAWVAVGGQPYKEWINMQNHTLNQDAGLPAYNTVTLLDYMTNRNPSVSAGPTAYTWYDELIVSTQPVAAPNN